MLVKWKPPAPFLRSYNGVVAREDTRPGNKEPPDLGSEMRRRDASNLFSPYFFQPSNGPYNYFCQEFNRYADLPIFFEPDDVSPGLVEIFRIKILGNQPILR